MTKFKVEIHKFGSKNSPILKMVAKHNGREVPFSISDFLSFESHEKALEAFSEGFTISRDEGDENKFYVSEDGGKTFTLTIEEIEIHELAEQ